MVVTAARPALSWVVLPTDIRTSDTGIVGVPILLLVSICVDHSIFRADGNRLLEVQELRNLLFSPQTFPRRLNRLRKSPDAAEKSTSGPKAPLQIQHLRHD